MNTPVSSAHDHTLTAVDWARDVPRLRGEEREEALANAKAMFEAAHEILGSLPAEVYGESLRLHRELCAPVFADFPPGVPFKFRLLQELIPNRHRFALIKERQQDDVLRVANL